MAWDTSTSPLSSTDSLFAGTVTVSPPWSSTSATSPSRATTSRPLGSTSRALATKREISSASWARIEDSTSVCDEAV